MSPSFLYDRYAVTIVSPTRTLLSAAAFALSASSNWMNPIGGLLSLQTGTYADLMRPNLQACLSAHKRERSQCHITEGASPQKTHKNTV